MNKFWKLMKAMIDGLHKLVLTFWRMSYLAKNLKVALA